MSTPTKTPYSVIAPLAQRLLNALLPYCQRIALAGSLRRAKLMVGDIEVVAIPRPQLDLFSHPIAGPTSLDTFLNGRVQFTKNGNRYKQFAYGRHTVDLFLTTPDTWGSIYTIRTGSADFSHWLVTAQPHGAAPWGLLFQSGRLHAHGRLLSTPEETDVFNALGLAYIDPALRTGPLPDAARIDPIWNYA